MLSWLSVHWIAVVVVVVGSVVGRGLLRTLLHRHKMAVGRSQSVVFCNHCGWKGSVERTTRACGRCGSGALTLQTS